MVCKAMGAAHCQCPLVCPILKIFVLILVLAAARQLMDHKLAFQPEKIPLRSDDVDPWWKIFLSSKAWAE